MRVCGRDSSESLRDGGAFACVASQQDQGGWPFTGAWTICLDTKLVIHLAHTLVILVTSRDDHHPGRTGEAVKRRQFAKNRFKDGLCDPGFFMVSDGENRQLRHRAAFGDRSCGFASQSRKEKVAVEDRARGLEDKPAPTPKAEAAKHQQDLDSMRCPIKEMS